MSETIDFYRKNGFVVIKQFFTKPEINSVLAGAEEVFEARLRDLNLDTSGSLFEKMKRLLNFDVKAYLGAAKIVPKLFSTLKFCQSEKLASLLQTEINLTRLSIPSEPVFHINSDQLRIPQGYYGFGAHQDWTSIQGSLDAIVAWIPLTNVTAQNFPLLVAPGSHRLGLIHGSIEENLMRVDECHVKDSEYVPAVVEAGDLVIMSVWTVHKTGIENCSGFRLSVSNRWENVQEETFSKRNFPCAYVKSVKRELFLPEFPTQEQVENIFNSAPRG